MEIIAGAKILSNARKITDAVGGGMGVKGIFDFVNCVFERNFRAHQAQLERAFQEKQEDIRQRHAEWMQRNDQDFRARMQQSDHAHQFAMQAESERVSKELAEIQSQNALKLQAEAFRMNTTKELRNEFVHDSWPFYLSPEEYMKRLEECRKGHGVFPLNVIIPDDSFKLSAIDAFFSEHYSMNSMSPVYEYSGGWKREFLERMNGTALVNNLHGVLKQPTLVLIPEKINGTVELRAAYWGMGAGQFPESRILFSVNVDELELAIMRKMAEESLKAYEKIGLKCPENSNMEVRQQELAIMEKGRASGVPLEELQPILRDCASRYSKAGLEDRLEKEMTKIVSQLVERAGCIIADTHFLAENDAPPQFPALLAQMSSDEEKDEYAEALADAFEDVVRGERLLLERHGQVRNLMEVQCCSALHAALVAQAFMRAGYEDKARHFASLALDDLRVSIGDGYPTERQVKAIEALVGWMEASERKLLNGKVEAKHQEEDKRRRGLAILGENWTATLSGGVKLEMIWVEPGTFLMGGSTSAYQVTLTKGYWIGKYPFTQEQWKAIRASKKNVCMWIGDRRPVETVNWEEAIECCKQLNEQLSDKLLSGYRFSLPTEAQWEFAAQGGLKSHGYEYSGSNKVEEVAWSSENSGGCSHDVGLKKPNELGIHDMSGNVYEWCFDYYVDYPIGAVFDPLGPLESWHNRVTRGGSWDYYSGGCHLTWRSNNGQLSSWKDLGFRVALVPVQ